MPPTPPAKTVMSILKFADGATISYNQASGHLSAKNCKTAEIHATESITADTPSFTCSGDVTIDGKLSVKGEISTDSNVSAQGAMTAHGLCAESMVHSYLSWSTVR